MKLLMLLAGVMSVPAFAAGGDLDANDYVGFSFWLVTRHYGAGRTHAVVRRRGRRSAQGGTAAGLQPAGCGGFPSS